MPTLSGQYRHQHGCLAAADPVAGVRRQEFDHPTNLVASIDAPASGWAFDLDARDDAVEVWNGEASTRTASDPMVASPQIGQADGSAAIHA